MFAIHSFLSSIFQWLSLSLIDSSPRKRMTHHMAWLVLEAGSGKARPSAEACGIVF